MKFFMIFSKIFLEKLNLIFFLQTLEFLNLKLGAVRVLSSVANLNFNFHFSNPCTFRDMSFLMIFSKPFKTLSLQKIKFEDLRPEVGNCKSFLRTCRSCL